MEPTETFRYDITFIGAGNVAWHLAQALYHSGHRIVQIFSRSHETASALADKVNARPVTDYREILPTAQLYIYALKDDILPAAIEQMPITSGIHIHTSGSMPMNVFERTKQHYGCLYPLQTFSKQKAVAVAEVPFFIEANTPETENVIYDTAHSIANQIYRLCSEDRKSLHLAGVFACNFTNLMYRKTEQLLAEKNLPFGIMKGLITEAVNKALCIGPSHSQTGPAERGDRKIINQHIAMLADTPEWQEIYSTLSDMIEKHRIDNTPSRL